MRYPGWRRLAVLLGAALAAGFAVGWFAVGPLIALHLGHGGVMRLPAPALTSPAPSPSRSVVPRHRAVLPPVPARRSSRPVVTYSPTHARPRPRPSHTPRPARRPTPVPTLTPTPTVSPSLTPSAMPSSVPPSGTVPAVMPTVTDGILPSP